MRTMTLNLSSKEMEVLENLALSKGMSKTAVMRQVLRFYQMIDRKISEGKRMSFDGEIVEVFGCMGDD